VWRGGDGVAGEPGGSLGEWRGIQDQTAAATACRERYSARLAGSRGAAGALQTISQTTYEIVVATIGPPTIPCLAEGQERS